MPSIFVLAAAMPVNTTIIVLCSVIWFWMWNKRMGYDQVAISYRHVMEERHWYRIVTAAMTHLDIMHLVFNMAGLWSVGLVESWLGHMWYVETTVLLLFLSEGIWLGLMHVLIYRFGKTGYMDSSAVGYSGVLFGWMTLIQMVDFSYSISLPGGISLPIVLMPFVYLVVTKMLIPRSSLLGHLAGILAGYLVGWGAFNWLRGYWLWTSTLYLVVLIILSLSANRSLPAWVNRVVRVSPEYLRSTATVGITGEVVQRDTSTARRFLDNGYLRVFRPLERAQIVAAPAPAAILVASGAGATATAPPLPVPAPAAASLDSARESRLAQLQRLLGNRFGPSTASESGTHRPTAAHGTSGGGGQRLGGGASSRSVTAAVDPRTAAAASSVPHASSASGSGGRLDIEEDADDAEETAGFVGGASAGGRPGRPASSASQGRRPNLHGGAAGS